MARVERQILALNAGSGSLRVSLFDWTTEQQLADEYLDWTQPTSEAPVHNHAEALNELLQRVDMEGVIAVGHRVVHGGSAYQEGVRVDAAVEAEIDRLGVLAPLHNAAALAGMHAVKRVLPDVPAVAVFDTAFHRTLPPHAYMYALPYSWHERWDLRRFGFHGLSHAYCAERAATLLQQPIEQTKLVVCHLGSGCSLAAIDGGRSIATTMGFTPLEGLMMSSRSGSVDPGLLLYLLRRLHCSLEELDEALNHDSGLKGIAGAKDMRDVVAKQQAGDERAALAFNMYTARIREGIGAMAAALGGLDAVIFTDGVGEHMPEVRAAIVDPLAWLGIALDAERNAEAEPDTDVATADSAVRVLVIHTREDLMVARETRRVLAERGAAGKD